jgi:hypothetical protein
MTKEELELVKRVASTLEPFYTDNQIPEIWDELAQSHIPVRTFEDLKELVPNWVIEVCREGEWKTAYCYVVPKRNLKRVSIAFFGHVEADLNYVYVKSLQKLPFDNEKQVKAFVPLKDWWRFYKPVIFTGENFYIVPTNKDKVAEDVKFFEESAEEVLELLAKYAYLFDKVKEAPSEALQVAKSTDERLHIILSHIAVLEWTRIQMMTAPLPYVRLWDKWD